MATNEAAASVFDVAAYILRRTGAITAMKLEKLVYYVQAWSLVWDERPLFADPIEAWANGPVVSALFKEHRGQFALSAIRYGDPDRLDATAQETVDAVLNFYGGMTAQQLSDLTHAERPWREARDGLPDDAPSGHEIPLASMAEYYGSLRP